MRAVVTGGTGFIGRAICTAAPAVFDSVIAVARSPRIGMSTQVVQLDLRASGAIDKFLDDCTILFHLAGTASVRRSIETPLADFEANLIPCVNMLESCRRTGAQLIFISSAAVYGEAKGRPSREDDAPDPISPYGAAKAACEYYCRTYHRSYGVGVNIVRPFNVYGPGMNSSAILDFYRKLKQDPTQLQLISDFCQVRDYLFIEDLAQGLLLVSQKGAPGQTYNIASGKKLTILEVAQTVAEMMGLNPHILAGEKQIGDIDQISAEITKIKSLGFSPRFEFRKGLGRTLGWLESNPGVPPLF